MSGNTRRRSGADYVRWTAVDDPRMGYPLQCKIDYSDAEPRAFGYRPLSFCICGGAGPEECREHIAHMVVVAIDPHAYQRDGAGEGEQLDDFDDTGEDW